MRSAAMKQEPVTFEDVAIYFTRREWESLDEEQKTLYKEVMNDNYQMILSLNRPDIILNIQLGFEPYIQSKSERHPTGSLPEKNVKDGPGLEGCSDTTSQGCEVRRQRRYPRVNPFRWIKKDKKKKRRLSRSCRQISGRSMDMTESGEYKVQTSTEKRISDPSTCSSMDPEGDPEDEAAMNMSGGKDLNSDDGTMAQSSHPTEKAVDTRGASFIADTKQCKAATEGSREPPAIGCSHDEDDVNPTLSSDAADYKVLTVAETSDIPWKADSESPSKSTTPQNEPVKKERRSPPSKKKVSHHKKDRHVQFSEVVTMILIDHHDEERSAERGEMKLRSTHLPICYSVNEKDKKRFSSAVIEEDDKANDNALLPTEEGTKQERKNSTKDTTQHRKKQIVERSGISQQAPNSHPDTTQHRKRKIMEGLGISRQAPNSHPDTTQHGKRQIVEGSGISQQAPNSHPDTAQHRKRQIVEGSSISQQAPNSHPDITHHRKRQIVEGSGISQQALNSHPDTTQHRKRQIVEGSGISQQAPNSHPDITHHRKRQIVEGSGISQQAPNSHPDITHHRKRQIVEGSGISQQAPNSHPDITQHRKRQIVEGSGISQQAPELNALSPTIKKKHELHSVGMNEVVNVRRLNTRIKDIKVDACLTSAQLKSPPHGHESRFIKSYSCSKCGKITHWSKLTVHQKENIERSFAHMCRACCHQTSCSSVSAPPQTIRPLSLTTAPAQTIPPLSLTTAPAQPIRPLSLTTAPSQTIPPLSLTNAPALTSHLLSHTTAPAHTIPPLSLTATSALTIPPFSLTTPPAQTIPHMSLTTTPAKTIPPLSLTTAPAKTIPPLSLTTAPAKTFSPLSLKSATGFRETSPPVNRNQKISGSRAQSNTEISSTEKKERRYKVETNEKTIEDLGSLMTAGDHYKNPPHTAPHHPDVCSKCAGPTLDPKLKPFTGSSANHTSTADPLILNLTWSRIGSKDKKATSKTFPEQPGKNVDIKEHKVCRKCGELFTPKQRNNPSSSNQQETPAKSSPNVLQKTQGCANAALAMHSTYVNISSGAETHASEKDCTKCGKRLKLHVMASPEDPAEGGEKKCVLRLKKKRKRPLDDMEPFKCKECGKSFTRHFTLLQHRTVHTGERPYSCKECGKSFRDGGYLKIHMRQHTKEKPYPCSECDKSFGQSSALIRHQRTHTDEKPFKCGDCGKRFSDLSTFRNHQLTHTGEKPFACSFCGKKFTQRAHVKRHEKMHTGERPFGCTMCEKRFIDRTKLKKHELIHTRKKI